MTINNYQSDTFHTCSSLPEAAANSAVSTVSLRETELRSLLNLVTLCVMIWSLLLHHQDLKQQLTACLLTRMFALTY